jgi:tetratricopeptide (TPR) repeat protein
LTEELISVLSQIRGLRVISRTSVWQFRDSSKPVSQIGAELGVSSVLEGSVRKAGDQLRITVQLIDVRTDEHRWAQTYDRTLDNVFAIQAEVAKQTAGALRVELLKSDQEAIQERSTANLAAYEHYLRGIQLFQRYTAAIGIQSKTKAVRCLERAIREDPAFSAAYSYLANVLLAASGEELPGRDVFPRARELVTRALELNPNSPDAHAASGNLAMQADQEWTRAEVEFQRAIELNPSSSSARFWYGYLLSTLQRFREAKEQLRIAIDLDPLWLLPKIHLAQSYRHSGDSDAERTLSVQITKHLSRGLSDRATLAGVYVNLGRAKDAERVLEPLARSPEPYVRGARAWILARLGRFEAAREWLTEWERSSPKPYIPLARVAGLYACLGDKSRALDLLEEDLERGDRGLWNLYQGRLFDSIRADPRFIAILRAMKLPLSPP